MVYDLSFTRIISYLILLCLCSIVASASEDAEPEHFEAEQTVPSFNHDTQVVPPNGSTTKSTLLPPGVTGRPTVVEYRFGSKTGDHVKDNSGPVLRSWFSLQFVIAITALFCYFIMI